MQKEVKSFISIFAVLIIYNVLYGDNCFGC